MAEIKREAGGFFFIVIIKTFMYQNGTLKNNKTEFEKKKTY